MQDLFAVAKDYLEERYTRPIHTVVAVLETSRGVIYKAVNIDHFSGFVCAETSALASAINSGDTHFKRIIAVRKEQDGKIVVANMCGKCRQIFYDYTPGISVGASDENGLHDVPIDQLLPYSFSRQKEKIQAALNGENIEVIG